MKYIQKFNESVNQSNKITNSDFELIENLFLFWSDERNIYYCSLDKFWKEFDPEIGLLDDTEKIKLSFPILELDADIPGRNYEDFEEFSRKSWKVGWKGTLGKKDDFLFGLGLYPSSPTKKFSKNIRNVEDLEKMFPKRKTKKSEYLILNFLNAHYDIKDRLSAILMRTKGLDHYGFKSDLILYCEVKIYLGSATFECGLELIIKK